MQHNQQFLSITLLSLSIFASAFLTQNERLAKTDTKPHDFIAKNTTLASINDTHSVNAKFKPPPPKDSEGQMELNGFLINYGAYDYLQPFRCDKMCRNFFGIQFVQSARYNMKNYFETGVLPKTQTVVNFNAHFTVSGIPIEQTMSISVQQIVVTEELWSVNDMDADLLFDTINQLYQELQFKNRYIQEIFRNVAISIVDKRDDPPEPESEPEVLLELLFRTTIS